MTSTDDYVLQLAIDRGMVSVAQVEAARPVGAPESEKALSAALVENGAISAWDVTRLLAQEFRMEVIDLREVRPASDAVKAMPKAVASRYRALPLDTKGGVLRVAIADPLDLETLDGLAQVLQRPIEPVLAPRDQIERALERAYAAAPDRARAPDDRLETAATSEDVGQDPAVVGQGAADAPVIQLVRDLIEEALRRRASDIHVEPLERRLRVRYRVDGVLLEAADAPQPLQRAIVSRLKLMANISIAEKRVPQDGRLQVTIDGTPLDLRVSSLPTAHGESIVMRILDRQTLRLGLPDLGLLPDDQETFQRLLALPDGMLLVTGPTGSGKTTTLYSCLHHLNRPDRKLITVEDPIEYQLPGINQVPVRPGVGMTFAAALRAMLRQSPDTVMVGEIRDRETTEIAIHASLTGHQVFSTLHTNDAPGAVARLINLGAKPFLLATTLRAVMAQRLVRRVCTACAGEEEPAASELAAIGLGARELRTAGFRRGRGCPHCLGTGYHGRIGLFEIFVVNEQIQPMIHDHAGTARLRAAARSSGMRTLREDGLRKASAGLTTIEEVLSLTVGEPG